MTPHPVNRPCRRLNTMFVRRPGMPTLMRGFQIDIVNGYGATQEALEELEELGSRLEAEAGLRPRRPDRRGARFERPGCGSRSCVGRGFCAGRPQIGASARQRRGLPLGTECSRRVRSEG